MKESMQTGNGFDMLCEHTKRVLETEELGKISAAKLKRWADLASIWYNNQEKLGLDVFYTILHKIHWGICPDGTYDTGIKRAMENLLPLRHTAPTQAALRAHARAGSPRPVSEDQLRSNPDIHADACRVRSLQS